MGTKNLNENGPNPFIFLGGDQKHGQRHSHGNGFVLAGFRQLVYVCLFGEDSKMKLPNGNGNLFFKTRE